MDISTLSQLVSNLGFPIFVAGFMLLKQSKDTEAMTSILSRLEVAINSITKGEKTSE